MVSIPKALRYTGCLIALIWAGWLIAAIRAASISPDCVDKLAKVADSFGVITSALTAAALLAAVYGGILQYRALDFERTRSHCERTIHNAERTAFAFRHIQKFFSDLLIESYSKADAGEEVDPYFIKTTLLLSQSEAEILVGTHFKELEPHLTEIREALGLLYDQLGTKPFYKLKDEGMNVINLCQAGITGANRVAQRLSHRLDLSMQDHQE